MLISRKEAESRLEGKELGTFLVRFSTTRPGCLSISFVANESNSIDNQQGSSSNNDNGIIIKHCLLEPTIHGFILFKVDKQVCYPTLKSCIDDCSVLKKLTGGQTKEDAFAQLDLLSV